MSRRLLHLLDFAPTGTRTFDHFVLGLATLALRKDWRVRLAFSGEPSPAFAESLRTLGAPYCVAPMPFTMASRRALRRQLGDYRPTVTLTDFLSAFSPAVVAMKLCGDTRRLVVRDNSSGTARPGGPVQALARALRGRAVGRVLDASVPVSDFVARRNVEVMGLPADKVFTVPNGIDADRYTFAERTPGPALRVAFAGQLTLEKGPDTLLAALAVLQQRGVAFEARVAGRGPAEAALRAQAATLGHGGVQFLGHVDSVPELFAWAEVVVVPSRWAEAFGLVAAEAMAAGAAVVVSDAGALPEVVGDAGRVFPAGDAAALAGVLLALAADPAERRRLGRTARDRVGAEFRLVDTVESVYHILERVSAGRSPDTRSPPGVSPCPNDSNLAAAGPPDSP